MSHHDELDDRLTGYYEQIMDHERESHEMKRMTLPEERVYQSRPEDDIDDENYKKGHVKR
jgi:hypothetical protein